MDVINVMGVMDVMDVMAPYSRAISTEAKSKGTVLSPRCDAGSGSGRRICTPGRLPGVER